LFAVGPFELSTVLAVSRADLDTAALDAGRTWPTALAVRADAPGEIPHAALRSYP
jgi:hypothetical protein